MKSLERHAKAFQCQPLDRWKDAEQGRDLLWDAFYLLKKKYIYLFLVALGLSHDTWASLVETCGLSSCGPQT